MLDQFRAVVETLSFNPPSIPMVSTVTDAEAISTPRYWVDHARQPVRFADAVTTSNADVFLEVGPDAVLSALVDNGIPLLRADQPEPRQVVTAVGRAFTHGVPVAW